MTAEHDPGTAAVAVLGLGNVLMGDDALGPWVVAQLAAAYDFPPEVEVLDLGTPGLDLHPHIAGRRALVLVDVVRSDAPAGTLRRYTKDEILRHVPGPRVSPHDPGVKEALLSLEFAGGGPAEVVLVGVVPQEVSSGTSLSAPVRAAADAAVQAVVDELVRLGCPPRRRAAPAAPDLWWEAAGGA
ncbi:MAG TPA: hydrogenase maturation protease [Candidatus Krumholzibacteria bacterium]|nr:hydrogenase maturation protease [Candidatus Krumholzibacteria bacterium]